MLHMVVSDYVFPLACIRVTAGSKNLKKAYTHDILLVPHPPNVPAHPPNPTWVGGGVGLGGGVGHWGVGVLEEYLVYIHS
jgi:hypothetical protein